MKKYSAYKSSNIDWIGDFPNHWSIKRLKYLVTLINEKASDNNQIRKISLENIESFSGKLINLNSDVEFTDEGKNFDKGDILFNKLRPYLAKVYKAIEKGICLGELLVLRSSSEITSDFLYYRVISEPFISEVNSSTYGSKMPRASWDFIRNLTIPYPSKIEQTIITQYLNIKLQKIDDLISKKQKLIDLLEEERIVVINQSIIKGINPDDEMKDSGSEWIGEIPAHWEVKKLKYIVLELQSGVSVNSYDYPANSHDVGILKTSCVYDYTFRSGENKKVLEAELSRTSCPVIKNSIIISRMNTPELVGASGYIEYDYPNLFLPDRLWQLRVKSEKEVWVPWLYRLMISFQFRDLLSVLATGTSASMKNISQGDLLNILIPYPEIHEQIKISDFIQTQTTKIDNTISRVEKEIELLQEYRAALISEVVTGKLDVRDEVVSWT